MNAEARGVLGVLARLRQEIGYDRHALKRHYAETCGLLSDWSEARAGEYAMAAVALHGWYTALESLLERIARQLDRQVPEGDTWHRDLLFQVTAELPSTRPAVLGSELLDDLMKLLSFRHFFRHAYAVDWDAERLQAELLRLRTIHPIVDVALAEFDEFLRRTMDAIVHDPR